MSRVFITGVGCQLGLGSDLETVGRSLAADRTAFAESAILPGQPVSGTRAPEDAGFFEDATEDAALARLKGWRHRRYLNRGASLAVLSGLRAAASAGLLEAMPPDTELVGAAGPMLDFSERGVSPLEPDQLDALWLLRWLPNTGNAALARLLGLHGEGLTLGTACASALQALGEGFRRIRAGLSQRVLVTAGDSRLSAGGLHGYARAHALTRRLPPECASRPFSADRDGFVPGEGGAAFMLESGESARSRRAPVFGELLGFGASLDGGSLTAPEATGLYAERAVRAALSDSPSGAGYAVDWVSAHGTGTLLNDEAEARMLERVFPDSPPIMALKSWIGHGSAACGALELAVLMAAQAMPRVRNLSRPCSEKLDFVREERPFPGPVGLVENFGFGGQNAALVVRLEKACPQDGGGLSEDTAAGFPIEEGLC